MTFVVIPHLMKKLCIHNISIRVNLYQNQFINECARKNFLKFLLGDGHKDGRCSFVRYRRIYVLNIRYQTRAPIAIVKI